jgi:hypothetical protein
MMNMKSELKPYVISPEGCWIDPYGGAQGGSHFRWRDHWPTTTFPTPGRDANGKQAAHGSFYHLVDIPYTERTENIKAKIMLHGLTDGSIKDLVPSAHSWLHAPPMEVLSGNLINYGYDRNEKAYKFTDDGDPEKSFSIYIEASGEHPAIHPAIIIEQCSWISTKVFIDGKPLRYGIDYTVGSEKEMDITQLVIWLNKDITNPAKIKIEENL